MLCHQSLSKVAVVVGWERGGGGGGGGLGEGWCRIIIISNLTSVEVDFKLC